jgi:hypothetical protein
MLMIQNFPTTQETPAITTPWLRWLPTRVSMNWPHQEG